MIINLSCFSYQLSCMEKEIQNSDISLNDYILVSNMMYEILERMICVLIPNFHMGNFSNYLKCIRKISNSKSFISLIIKVISGKIQIPNVHESILLDQFKNKKKSLDEYMTIIKNKYLSIFTANSIELNLMIIIHCASMTLDTITCEQDSFVMFCDSELFYTNLMYTINYASIVLQGNDTNVRRFSYFDFKKENLDSLQSKEISEQIQKIDNTIIRTDDVNFYHIGNINLKKQRIQTLKTNTIMDVKHTNCNCKVTSTDIIQTSNKTNIESRQHEIGNCYSLIKKFNELRSAYDYTIYLPTLVKLEIEKLIKYYIENQDNKLSIINFFAKMHYHNAKTMPSYIFNVIYLDKNNRPSIFSMFWKNVIDYFHYEKNMGWKDYINYFNIFIQFCKNIDEIIVSIFEKKEYKYWAIMYYILTYKYKQLFMETFFTFAGSYLTRKSKNQDVINIVSKEQILGLMKKLNISKDLYNPISFRQFCNIDMEICLESSNILQIKQQKLIKSLTESAMYEFLEFIAKIEDKSVKDLYQEYKDIIYDHELSFCICGDIIEMKNKLNELENEVKKKQLSTRGDLVAINNKLNEAADDKTKKTCIFESFNTTMREDVDNFLDNGRARFNNLNIVKPNTIDDLIKQITSEILNNSLPKKKGILTVVIDSMFASLKSVDRMIFIEKCDKLMKECCCINQKAKPNHLINTVNIRLYKTLIEYDCLDCDSLENLQIENEQNYDEDKTTCTLTTYMFLQESKNQISHVNIGQIMASVNNVSFEQCQKNIKRILAERTTTQDKTVLSARQTIREKLYKVYTKNISLSFMEGILADIVNKMTSEKNTNMNLKLQDLASVAKEHYQSVYNVMKFYTYNKHLYQMFCKNSTEYAKMKQNKRIHTSNPKDYIANINGDYETAKLL